MIFSDTTADSPPALAANACRDGIMSLGKAAQFSGVDHIDRKTEGKLFPQYPAVRWRGAMGMRDVLAHTYFHVDAEQLFNICKNDIPTMIATLETMLSDLQQVERN